ncbi:hypothetical protein Tco_1279325 [Tanacetum coccineum]
MNSLSFTFQTLITSNHDSVRYSNIHFRSSTIGCANAGSSSVGVNFKLRNCGLVSDRTRCSVSNSEDEVEGTVEEVMIPKEWMNPSKAAEESEWLRVTLHKWLDDEYCPEPTNVDISNVAARSYYKSLTENQTDLGDILLRMAMELETISFKESFHGAFSSANAAVNLILQRIMQE